MVVAVKADDNADTLSAAAGYTFGVQYATGGDQTKSAVKQIEKELGQNITLQEYSIQNIFPPIPFPFAAICVSKVIPSRISSTPISTRK